MQAGHAGPAVVLDGGTDHSHGSAHLDVSEHGRGLGRLQGDGDGAEFDLAGLDGARGVELGEPLTHDGAAHARDAVETVEADAVRVQVGKAGHAGLRPDVAGLDRDDRIVRSGLVARVGEHNVAVLLADDRAATRAEQAVDGVPGVHAGAARGGPDAGKGPLVAEDDRRRSVEQAQPLVEGVEGLVFGAGVGVEVGPVGDLGGAELRRRAGQGLVEAVERLGVDCRVAVDDGVLELGPGGLDLLLHVQRDGAGRVRADTGDHPVDLERPTHHGEVDRVALGRDVLRGVLGVERAERRGRLRDEPAVAIGEGVAPIGRVDDVGERQRVEDRRFLAELVDHGDVDVVLCVVLRLGESDGHGVLLVQAPRRAAMASCREPGLRSCGVALPKSAPPRAGPTWAARCGCACTAALIASVTALWSLGSTAASAVMADCESSRAATFAPAAGAVRKTAA
ncbi:hypothetical protein SFR_1612 [Streptomyces sp. FR-008]|nr:hypothetical protein SFR_1612 [Streptomyces sp. FR-008]